MNFRKVWVIMQSLLLSQLRATARRTASIRSLIRRPIVLVVLDVALFGVAAAAAYFVGSAIAGSSASELFSTFVSSALVILPAILLSIILLLGLVFEITSSYQFSSSDTVNWLPVASGEYVLASILSVVVYYSAVPAILIGGTMSLALTFGMFPAWEASVILSISSVFLAASVLALIRALLNRFSTSFYKKGGQAAVALRAVFGVAVIVVLQLLFYPSLYTHFVGAISASFGPAWFIPILWASVSVSALLNGSQSLALSFAGMSVALTLVMIYVASVARSRYWVPMPPSIRISTAVYRPRASSPFVGFLSAGQLAITRKDLKGLIRRKEMLRFLALPVVFLATSLFGISSAGSSSGGASTVFSGFSYFGIFIVGFSTFFLALSSVGAEGKSIVNLYQLPLTVKDFVVGKVITPIVFGSVFGVIFFSIVDVLFPPLEPALTLILPVLAIACATELAFVGLYVGARFPNFSEAPRASYISQTASLIAFPLAILMTGVSMSPLLFSIFFSASLSDLLIAFIATLGITAVLSFVFFIVASGRVRRLLSELPF